MKKNKRSFIAFIVSFLIAFIILITIFGILYYVKIEKTVDIPQQDIEYVKPYIPQENENMKILVIGCEELHLKPSLFLILDYDAINGTINVVVTPQNALSTVLVREDTVLGHYNYEGVTGCINAFKSLYVTDIDRYVRIDKYGIANLVDFLGGIDFTLKENVTITTQDGRKELFKGGEQLFDGRRTANLLLCGDKKLQSEISLAFFEQHFNEHLQGKLPQFISAFFYNSETNINQYDFALREKGLQKNLPQMKFSVELLQGKIDENNSLIPYDNSIKLLIDKLN